MRLKEFLKDGGRKYNDPYYDQTDTQAAQKVGIPVDILRAIRLAGEKSNEDQVSSAGARGVYQFIPSVRNSVLKKYGVDAWNPTQSSLAAAYLIKENADRNNGDYNIAVREYHGGIDRKNWGKINQAYISRIQNFTGNTSQEYQQNPQYVDMSSFNQSFQDMQKGLWDSPNIQKSYEQAPDFTKLMMDNINIQKDLEQTQRLEQERQQQEHNKKIQEQQNAQYEQMFKQDQEEKQQFLDMIPQSKPIPLGQI